MVDDKQTQPQDTTNHSKPDDQGNILIDGFIRIHDPNTNETLLEVRE